MTPRLFKPLNMRGVTLKNRIVMSPMCQYSSIDGFATDWHMVHLGTRAVGGVSLVITEATAVTPAGRISPADLGIWDDAHIDGLRRCTAFIEQHDAVAGIQLAHAGRKASTRVPWEGGGPIPISEGGWQTVAPSAIPFREGDPIPDPLTDGDIQTIIVAFAAAARRAMDAGFRVIELHAAHGYLLHEFLSPLSNRRDDRYGGSLENRMRFTCEVVQAVRAVLPDDFPLFVRISATDWAEGGWDADQSVELARVLGPMGVDLIDCSTGALIPGVHIPVSPGYHVEFAERIRRETGILTGAVGMITDPVQAEGIIEEGRADVIILARQLLREPYFALHAGKQLGADVEWPLQYQRARD
ncbi:MAG: NADH:flavin oxidoreductase/NADH oxidase [Gemmatimonadaceae bacterium]